MEEATRAAGLDETATGVFGGGIDHPFSRGGGSALSADVSYTIREPWAIGVAYVRGSEGRVLGFNGNPGFQNLTVGYSVATFAPKVSGVLGIAYASAGPALHLLKISAEETGGQSVQGAGSTSSKLGFLAEAGLRVPLPLHLSDAIRILVDVKSQYRYVGHATAGPYTPAALFGASPATFPATRFSLNDWFFGVGPGLRF